MAADTLGHFLQVHKEAEAAGILGAKTKEARDWYRLKAADLVKMNQTRLMLNQDLQSYNIQVGRLYLYVYDPLYKHDPRTLPYYDSFPLVLPLEMSEDHILGLNFHYLSHFYRAQLLDALYRLRNNKKMDETTYIQATYELLKESVRYAPYKACIKRYRIDHVMSKYIAIPAHEWDYVTFLPIERFHRETRSSVWHKSGKIIRGEK